MTNYIHLIALPCTESSLAKGIGEVHKRYTRMINFREAWRRYLFQGRLFSCALEPTKLLSVVRYHEEIFRKYVSEHRLINARSLRDGERLEMTFLIKPRKSADLMTLSRALSSYPSIDKAAVVICDDEGLAQNVF